MPDAIGGTETVWIGHYPGFCADKAYEYQVALSTDAKAERWGVTRKGVVSFLTTGVLPADRKPIARKAKDLKSLKG